MKKIIASRELLFSKKNSSGIFQPLTIHIYAPRLAQPHDIEFPLHENACFYVCEVEIIGLPDFFSERIFGADSLQALQLAINMDDYLKHLSKKYTFYFLNGDPYFPAESYYVSNEEK